MIEVHAEYRRWDVVQWFGGQEDGEDGYGDGNDDDENGSDNNDVSKWLTACPKAGHERTSELKPQARGYTGACKSRRLDTEYRDMWMGGLSATYRHPGSLS